jgi:cathepsin B
MKYIILALLVVSVFCWQQEAVDYINSHNFGWKAQVYDRWEGWTKEDFKKFLSLKVPAYHNIKVKTSGVSADSSWDWRDKSPACVGKIRDQAQCGSCWAFGCAESVGDRHCIQCNVARIILAPETLVSCDKTDYGCDGGYLNNAWNWVAANGLVTEACFPYDSQSGYVPPCPNSCPGTGNWGTRYKVSNVHQVKQDITTIENEIENKGPCEFSFAVYQDFMNYKSGVYTHQWGTLLGYHAVKGIGWGTSGSQPYWIIANSWNTSWGNQGYFWILKGKNECEIEQGIWAGDPSC